MVVSVAIVDVPADVAAAIAVVGFVLVYIVDTATAVSAGGVVVDAAAAVSLLC